MKPLRTEEESKAAPCGTDLTLQVNLKINILHDAMLFILDLLIMKITVHEQEQLSSQARLQRKLSLPSRLQELQSSCFLPV